MASLFSRVLYIAYNEPQQQGVVIMEESKRSIRKVIIQLINIKLESIAEQKDFYDRMWEIHSTTSDAIAQEYINRLIADSEKQFNAFLERIDNRIDRYHEILNSL